MQYSCIFGVKISDMLKKLFSILCLIFLFVLSQHAALSHQVSHIQDDLKQTHSKKSDSNFCPECAQFANLQYADHVFYTLHLDVLNHDTPFILGIYSYQSPAILNFAARDPPQHL